MQSFVAVLRNMGMIRAGLRCRIDMDRCIGEILLQGTGWRMQGALQDDVAGHAQSPASSRVSTGKIFRDMKKS